MEKTKGMLKVAASMHRSGRAVRVSMFVTTWVIGGVTAPTVREVAVVAARVVIAADAESRVAPQDNVIVIR